MVRNIGPLATCGISKPASGLAALALVVIVGWQLGAALLANIELRDDMQDIAFQLSLHDGGPELIIRNWRVESDIAR